MCLAEKAVPEVVARIVAELRAPCRTTEAGIGSCVVQRGDTCDAGSIPSLEQA
jgi:hypothetical protein